MKAGSDDLLKELIRENAAIRKELLWYKRTYDNRSAFRIGISRLLIKLGLIKNKPPAREKTNSETSIFIAKAKNKLSAEARILAVIFNHNFSNQATQLRGKINEFLDTIILDSGSKSPPADSVQFPNIFYGGMLNKAFTLAKNNKYEFLLVICSDVAIPDSSIEKLKIQLSGIGYERLGCYGPSSTGSDYVFSDLKNSHNKLRVVPFIEGFMFLGNVSLLEKILPLDTEQNKLGWGIDICLGFLCKENNMQCYIDDSVIVHHRKGTGYQRHEAKLEMLNWFSHLNKPGLLEFAHEQMSQSNNFKDQQI